MPSSDNPRGEWIEFLNKLGSLPKSFLDAGKSQTKLEPKRRERALKYVNKIDEDAQELSGEQEEELASRAPPQE